MARGHWLFLLLTVAAVNAFFFQPGFRGQVPAFRDGWHFYYPLLASIDSQSTTERLLPTYQPADGFGINRIGEATTAVFYPLRVILLIPIGSIEQRMAAFMWLHCVLAAVFAASAATRLGCRGNASVLAGLTYGLSSPVLFQHVNLPFLIGAAWAPLALAEILLLSRFTQPSLGTKVELSSDRRTSASTIPSMSRFVVAVVCMLLGGDIQSAAHAIILTTFMIIASLCTRRVQCAIQQLRWSAVAIVLIVGLAAVQLGPSYLWFAQSHRLAGDADRAATDRYLQLPSDSPHRAPRPLDTVLDSLSDQSVAASRHYDFSIAPWQSLTLLWPHVEGSYLPEHSRWTSGLPAEPRMWLPSLSFGVAPFLIWLATLTMRRRRRSNDTALRLGHIERFTFIVAVIAGSAMIGNYGPIWLLRNAIRAIGAGEIAGYLPTDDFGTTSWLLNHTVPFYSAFRFPAKWCTWFTCAMCLLVAMKLERANVTEIKQRLRMVAAAAGLVSFGLVVFSYVLTGDLQLGAISQGISDRWNDFAATAPHDAWLGALSPNAAARAIRFSGLLCTAVCSTLLLFGSRAETTPRFERLLVVITLADLIIAAHLLFHFMQAPVHEPPEDLSHITSREIHGLVIPQRLWANTALADFASDDDVSDPASGDRRTRSIADYQDKYRLGKLHLLHGEWNCAAIMTATPRAQSDVRSHLNQVDAMQASDSALAAQLAWLGITHRLVRESQARDSEGIHTDNRSDATSIGLRTHTNNALAWRSIAEDDQIAISGFAELIPLSHLQPNSGSSTEGTSKDAIKALSFEPDESQWIVQTPEPALLVLRQYQDGGWFAEVGDIWSSPQRIWPQRVEAFAGVFQAVEIPAGQSFVTLRYETPGLEPGGWISMVTAVTAVAIAAIRLRRKLIEPEKRR